MDEEIMFIQNEDGELEVYDDTYDVVVHCNSEEERQKVVGTLKNKIMDWIPINERLPGKGEYILVSFANEGVSLPDIAVYEVDSNGNGVFYPSDRNVPYSLIGVFVNAWMPLSEPYREEDD